jgi:predicted dehydrogenase
MTLRFAIAGCGGMGLRHALGYIEHRRVLGNRGGGLRLAAVFDRQSSAANHVADRVERETGDRPAVYDDFESLLAGEPHLDALDVVTATATHHTFALQALDAGLHVMTEKPMGLTLKTCRLMRSAAIRGGRTLAVAENFRRDPMNRLTRALIAAGAIGRPYFAVDIHIRSGMRSVMHGTAWRARRDQAGGVVLEVGVHHADLLLYLLGPVTRVTAETSTYEPLRPLGDLQAQAPVLAPFYGHRAESEGARGALVEHDAIDTGFAVIRFASGAIGQLLLTDASCGGRVEQSTVHGSEGTLVRSPSRSGRSPILVRHGEEVSGDALLALVPEFALDEATTMLWGGRSRIGSYGMEFAEVDRKIIALEYEDFAAAVRAGKQPEVGHKEGMEALALAYAILEAGESGRPVCLHDVVDGRVDAYQSGIDTSLGIA